jgi:hypothetical protein
MEEREREMDRVQCNLGNSKRAWEAGPQSCAPHPDLSELVTTIIKCGINVGEDAR